jgi:hypothetical protein
METLPLKYFEPFKWVMLALSYNIIYCEQERFQEDKSISSSQLQLLHIARVLVSSAEPMN